jgi:hypothetical protein
MKRILKTRNFVRWMKKTSLLDTALYKAVEEMENGLIDADLGRGVLKKRIGLPNKGKRGSVRTLVATNRGGLWIFVFGFEKNERSNISNQELDVLQSISHDLLNMSNKELDEAISSKVLTEVMV